MGALKRRKPRQKRRQGDLVTILIKLPEKSEKKKIAACAPRENGGKLSENGEISPENRKIFDPKPARRQGVLIERRGKGRGNFDNRNRSQGKGRGGGRSRNQY